MSNNFQISQCRGEISDVIITTRLFCVHCRVKTSRNDLLPRLAHANSVLSLNYQFLNFIKPPNSAVYLGCASHPSISTPSLSLHVGYRSCALRCLQISTFFLLKIDVTSDSLRVPQRQANAHARTKQNSGLAAAAMGVSCGAKACCGTLEN